MSQKDWAVRLDGQLAQGTLSEELLNEAVRTIEEEDTGLAGLVSAGAHWLFHSRPVYANGRWGRPTGYVWRCSTAFSGSGIDPTKFFEDHSDVPQFTKNAITCGAFLKLLPEGRRIQLVTHALMRHGAHTGSFVSACLEAEIPNDSIAKMVSTRLLALEIREGVWNELSDFLEYGLRQEWDNREERFVLPEDAPWAMFDNTSLKEFFLQAATKVPLVILKEQKKIQVRLGQDATTEICREAARHIDSLPAWLELGHFASLAAADKERLVAQIKLDYKTNAALVVGLVTEVALEKKGEQAVLAYFESVWDLLDKLEVYRSGYRIALGVVGKNKNHNAELILDLFFTRLRNAGYIIGRIEEQFHTGNRGRRLQYVVNHSGMKYVHDDFNHRWNPKSGDCVIVNTKGRRLTPTVALDCFLPLDKEIR